MKRSRWILIAGVAIVIFAAAWLWWMTPTKVDMAAYAPADSLLYIEADRPLAVAETLTATDAWRAFERTTHASHSGGGERLQKIIGWTGLGPIQSVVLTRAQVALVVTDLGTAEAGDTLKVKSEGAILIETHTSEWRIRPLFEEFLKSFAEKLYGRPSLQKIITDGVEFIEWLSPDGSRRMVGTVAGSLLIIGTSEAVVKTCLAVSQGRRPALKDDVELNRVRKQLGKESALTFGYVPPGNSSKLLAFGIPLLLGRAPGDSDFQRLITSGASKIFGSLAWSSRAYSAGIEDRYLISLQPGIVDRLKASFNPSSTTSKIQTLAPEEVYSVTSYRFNDPDSAWLSLKTAVSSQVDALSAIVFSSLLKSSLLSYGIDDPEGFFTVVHGEILTLRLDDPADRSVLVATVKNAAALRELLMKNKPLHRAASEEQAEMFEDREGEYGAALTNDIVVMGAPADVRRYVEFRKAGSNPGDGHVKKLTAFQSRLSAAPVITFANDGSRVRNFFATIQTARGVAVPSSADFEREISALPYSVTESVLGPGGIERTTRSPLGQFSTLLPLLLPEQ